MVLSFPLSNGNSIPSVGFGTFKDDGSSVRHALEAGFKLIDSATFYANEDTVTKVIAKYLADNKLPRSAVQYATKLHIPEGGGDYKKLKQLVQERLDKAKDLEYIDFLYIHSPLGNKEGRLALYGVIQEAYEAGKVKNIGVSNYGIHHFEELYAWDGLKVKPVVNQVEINPWLQRLDLRKWSEENGVLIQGYSTLMRGKRLDDPQLVKLAAKYNKTVAQILIRWNIQSGVPCLTKSSNEQRIKESIAVHDFELSKEDLAWLGDPESYFVTWAHWDPTKWFY